MRTTRRRYIMTFIVAACAVAAWIIWAFRGHGSSELVGPTLLTLIAVMFAFRTGASRIS